MWPHLELRWGVENVFMAPLFSTLQQSPSPISEGICVVLIAMFHANYDPILLYTTEERRWIG